MNSRPNDCYAFSNAHGPTNPSKPTECLRKYLGITFTQESYVWFSNLNVMSSNLEKGLKFKCPAGFEVINYSGLQWKSGFFQAVWPDTVKFCHFGKISKVFGNFLRVCSIFVKFFNLFWQILYDAFSKISLRQMAKCWTKMQPSCHPGEILL